MTALACNLGIQTERVFQEEIMEEEFGIRVLSSNFDAVNVSGLIGTGITLNKPSSANYD